MRSGPPLLLIGILGCATFGQSSGTKVALPPPPWTTKAVFHTKAESGYTLFGVGAAKLPETTEGCPNVEVVIDAAKARARMRLAALTKGEAQPAADVAIDGNTLLGFEPIRGWYARDTRTIYLLGKFSTADAPPNQAVLESYTPTLGLSLSELRSRVDAARTADIATVCIDPFKRAQSKCCGALNTFCADASRYSELQPDATCRCGTGAPCLYDFKCQDKGGEKKCVCTGKQCPCGSILNCDAGETCGDGRCY